MKVCSKCKIEKDESEFGISTRDGLYAACKECRALASKKYANNNRSTVNEKSRKYKSKNRDVINKRQREYAKSNVEKTKLRNLKYKYGIDEKDVDGLKTFQKYRCPICLKEFEKVKVCLDHDHDSLSIRGFICDNCNIGLGRFKDDVESLKRAIDYINNPPWVEYKKE